MDNQSHRRIIQSISAPILAVIIIISIIRKSCCRTLKCPCLGSIRRFPIAVFIRYRPGRIGGTICFQCIRVFFFFHLYAGNISRCYHRIFFTHCKRIDISGKDSRQILRNGIYRRYLVIQVYIRVSCGRIFISHINCFLTAVLFRNKNAIHRFI